MKLKAKVYNVVGKLNRRCVNVNASTYAHKFLLENLQEKTN
jgi:hypothetical protein